MENPYVRQHLEDVSAVIKGHPREAPGDEGRAAWLKQMWLRSIEQHKLDPAGPSRRYVYTAGELRQACGRIDEFRNIARPHLDDLYRQVRVASYCVVMTDSEGLTVDIKSEGEFGEVLKKVGVRIGTVWREEHEGTCGIGTAIVDRKPTLIHQSEHFRAENIGLSCSAAPIFDLDERLVAILDASAMYSPHKLDAQAMVFEMVNEKALTIENSYISHLLRGYWRVFLGRRPDHRAAHQDWMLAFDSAGVVVGANRPAREAVLSRFPGRRSVRLEDLLDTTADDLVAGAHAQPGLTVPLRLWAKHELVFGVLKPPECRTDQAVSITRPLLPATGDSANDALAHAAMGDATMLRNAGLARKLADRGVSIMLRGETGTGKEVFARAIHAVSSRQSKPFVALNCAAIPETLIESELFGYHKGAFTGAKAHGAQGKLLHSSGGTLFLDEIGDMPILMQSRLLRVLAEREVVPLGAESPVSLDLNVICASHRDLMTMVEEGAFREDLYYRLNGACIELPALRERQDMGALINQILAEEAKSLGRVGMQIHGTALDYLKALRWPGNIRQLRHALRYACAVADTDRLTLECFPSDLLDIKRMVVTKEVSDIEPHLMYKPGVPSSRSSDAVRSRMVDALNAYGWNVEEAAKCIGMPRSTFYRKMRALDITSRGEADLALEKRTP